MPSLVKMKWLILLVLILLPALAFAPMQQPNDPPITFQRRFILMDRYRSLTNKDISPPPLRLIARVEWSPDGKYLAAGVGGYLHIWEMEEGRKIFLQHLFDSSPVIVEWTSDSRYLAASNNRPDRADTTIHIWSENTQIIAFQVNMFDNKSSNYLAKVNWLPAYRLIAADAYGRLRVWDMSSQEYSIITEDAFITITPDQFSVSPDGLLVAYTEGIGSSCKLIIYDIDQQRIRDTIPYTTLEDCVFQLLWSPDQRFIFLQSGRLIYFFDLEQPKTVIFPNEPADLWGYRWHEDSRRILLRDWFEFTVYDVQQFSESIHLPGYWAAWSPDGNLLVSSAGQMLNFQEQEIVDLPFPDYFHGLYQDERWSRIHPYWLCDTPYILGAGADTILIWDSRTQELVTELNVEFEDIPIDFEINRLEISPQCNQFAVVGRYGFIQLFTYKITE